MPTVTTLKYHTHAGAEHHAGDVYDVPEEDVSNLVGQGMVAASDTPAPPKSSQPVEPMTSETFGKPAKGRK